MIFEFIPVLYGRAIIWESMAYLNGDKDVPVPIDLVIYYIRTERGRILIDAGCDGMKAFETFDFLGPVRALQNKGIDPDSITDILITHAHGDHIGGVKHFKNATVHIQREEYEKGKRVIPEGRRVNIFDEEFSLSDEISIIKVGGHSVGSCIVRVKFAGVNYIVCGDECYVRRCIEEKIPTGSSFNEEKSREFIEKYSSPEYTVFLSHEYREIDGKRAKK